MKLSEILLSTVVFVDLLAIVLSPKIDGSLLWLLGSITLIVHHLLNDQTDDRPLATIVFSWLAVTINLLLTVHHSALSDTVMISGLLISPLLFITAKVIEYRAQF